MSNFSKTSWTSRGYIAVALLKLRDIANDDLGQYTKDEKDGAREGIACLENTMPEYITNIIPQDHPDRIMALRLLTRKENDDAK